MSVGGVYPGYSGTSYDGKVTKEISSSVIRASSFTRLKGDSPTVPEVSWCKLIAETKGIGEDNTPYLRLEFEYMVRFPRASDGYTSVHGRGQWRYEASKQIRLHQTISFDPSSGKPLSVSAPVSLGEGVIWKIPSGDIKTFDPGRPDPAQSIDTVVAFSVKNALGIFLGEATAFESQWPMWEISGANFRFFGQNWIRLIKVSGP